MKEDIKKGIISIENNNLGPIKVYAPTGKGKAFRDFNGGTRNRFIADLNRFINTRGGGDFEGFDLKTNFQPLLSIYCQKNILKTVISNL